MVFDLLCYALQPQGPVSYGYTPGNTETGKGAGKVHVNNWLCCLCTANMYICASSSLRSYHENLKQMKEMERYIFMYALMLC